MHAYSVVLKDMSMQKLTKVNGVRNVQISSNGTFLLDTYSTLSSDPQDLRWFLKDRKLRTQQISPQPEVGLFAIYTAQQILLPPKT